MHSFCPLHPTHSHLPADACCPLCLESFRASQKRFLELPCGAKHFAHEVCLRKMIAGGSLTCPLCRKYVAGEDTIYRYERLLQREWLSNLAERKEVLAPVGVSAARLCSGSFSPGQGDALTPQAEEKLVSIAASAPRAKALLVSCYCNECGKHFASVESRVHVHRCPECGRFNAVELSIISSETVAGGLPPALLREISSGVECVMAAMRREG